MSNILEEVAKLVDLVPASAMMSWLKANEKPHSATNKANLTEKLVKWINEKTISLEDIKAAVVEIEENGGKKIKLKTISNFDIIKFKKHLKSKNIELAKTDRVSLRNNRISTLNYIFIDENNETLKIKWSEIQENVDINYQNRTLNSKPKVIFVVVVIELETGFTQIRYDTPQDIHAHIDDNGVKKDYLYENHYLLKLRNLLPVSFNITDYNIDKPARYLLRNEKEKFRIENENLNVSQGGKQKYSRNGSDIRDLEARKGAEERDGDNWVVNNLTGYWLSIKSGGILTRDLFMRMSRSDSTINFQRDCLSQELNYAIDEIRRIKDQV